MPESALAVHGVVKEFGRGAKLRRALDEVSLEVPPGQICGVLGPNGAGKTTLVRVCSTMLRPERGTVTVAGFDVVTQTADVRRSIGVVLGGDRGLYPRLTGQREPGVLGLAVPAAATGGEPAGGRAARTGRPRRPWRRPGFHLFPRHEATVAPGPRHGRRPTGAVPGRADHRVGPDRHPLAARDRGGAVRPRRHHPADHARHGRGGGAVRPGAAGLARPDPAARRAR